MPRPELTDKEKAANDEYMSDPKRITKTEAIRRVYNVKNPKSAGAMVPQVFNKPAAVRYREEHANEARDTILYHMRNKDNPKLSFDAARDVLDRTDGKPTQKVQTESKKVVINADFTGGDASRKRVEASQDGSAEASPSSEVPGVSPSQPSAAG